MIGKKAGMELEAILGIILSILALVFVIFGAYSYFSGNALPFFSNLPGFQEEEVKIEGVELVRYLVEEDRAQYYDGLAWRDFPRGEPEKRFVQLNNKEVYYNEIRDKLKNHYYSSPRPVEKISFKNYPEVELSRLDIVPLNLFNPLDAPLGSVVFYFSNPSGTREDVAITTSNKVLRYSPGFLKRYKLSLVPESEKEYYILAEKVVAWRDSSLGNPVQIIYKPLDNSEVNAVSVCPRMFDGALVVDLARRDANCGVLT